MYKTESEKIQEVIELYFTGLYKGKKELLEEAFHQKMQLFGDINGEPYYREVGDFLDGVAKRESPESLGEDFRMKILSLEILGNIAVTKLHVPMFEFNYFDYLLLHKINGKWTVVSKSFIHFEN
ncbi:nuclear transport factor 2 family protein [Leptobacterium flavescens]|nr:nuclear transport factor 2 family protein [Leptobacterium flavescens]